MGRLAEQGWRRDVTPTWVDRTAQRERRAQARRTGPLPEATHDLVAATMHRDRWSPGPDLASGAGPAARVFISYRSSDSPGYAALLYLELSHRFGSEVVFLDTQSIPAGGDFAQYLFGQLRGCRSMLAVIGPRWLTAAGPAEQRPVDDPRDWIRRELVVAFGDGIPVIPVLTDDADMPGQADLPADIAALARCQYRRLRHSDIRADLDRITADLMRLDSALVTADQHADQPSS
jgi:hypothetical protein